MIELTGKYNKDCKIFIDDIEQSAMDTIYNILNHPVSEGIPIRIMPDVHDGVDIVIGFTMPLRNFVNPNHIGVDIGCGVLCIGIPKLKMPLSEINTKIRDVVPMGFSHRQASVFDGDKMDGLKELSDKVELDFGDVCRQIGTLGGGNHFIEIGENGDAWYLFIHTGSRNFGLKVCQYHSKKAKNHQSAYSYLESVEKDEYMTDMRIAQKFAKINRNVIAKSILDALEIRKSEIICDTIHNYIGKDNIIRKGAVSAYSGEKLVIPMNMRDGTLICMGKGNPDWNFSAPHGAGRILSRGAAKKTVNIEDFRTTMQGVYSTSISESTLDESPFAYKDMDVIIECIRNTVNIIDIVKPILNIKAL